MGKPTNHNANNYSAKNHSAINHSTIDFLLSQIGRKAVDALHTADLSERNKLTLLTSLRRQHSAPEAGAILALAQLRQRAANKFPHAEKLFFVPEALEQATTWQIAARRAQWIDQHAPAGSILDLGCGIGGDTLALAQHRHVIAYERDEVRLRLAQANAAALNLDHRIDFRHADWLADLETQTLPDAAAAYVDPARRITNERGHNQRVYSLHQTEPPLAALLTLAQQVSALCVKIMPGVSDDELPPNCDVEFISHDKTCKEAVLWFGSLRASSPLSQKNSAQTIDGEKMPIPAAPRNAGSFAATVATRRASVATSHGWQTITASGDAPPVGDLQVGQFLHEPDPAVIRAGAFAELCADLNAHLFDPQIAYLVTNQAGAHPLTQTFELLDVAPFSIKQLNKRLQAFGIEQVELKKRGFPVEPEELRSRLKLAKNAKSRNNSDNNGVVIFTRQGDKRIMLIAKRINTL